MSFSKVTTAAIAALAMTATPVLAAAPAASKLSVSKVVRVGAKTTEANQAVGGGVIIAILAAAAVIAGIIIAADNNRSPVSR